MKLPRRSREALRLLALVLLFGLVGLAWWIYRRRRPCDGPGRLPRARQAFVVGCLLLIAVGTLGRFDAVFQPIPSCTPPGGYAPDSTRTSRLGASLVAQQAATWPQTGLGLLYSRARHARVCLSQAADYLVALHADNIAGTKAMTMGDIVLTPGFDMSAEQRDRLIRHEARHRAQWAIGTAVAGPFAFPIAYAIEDFFFPGSRNFFERQAGLSEGGYRPVGLGPVLGPAQIVVLVVMAALLVAAVRRRRRSRSAAGEGVGVPLASTVARTDEVGRPRGHARAPHRRW